MINLRFFSDMLVLPLRGLLLFPQALGIDRTRKVRRLVWNVTRDIDDALRLISPWYSSSPPDARESIEDLATRSRDCGHVAMLAAHDYYHQKDEGWVRHWIDTARNNQYANQPMLMYLELILCNTRQNPSAAIELSGNILERGDFPPTITYTAMYNRIIAMLHLNRIDEAERLLTRMVSIKQDNTSISLAISLRLARGNSQVDDLLSKIEPGDENQRKAVLNLARVNAGDRQENTFDI